MGTSATSGNHHAGYSLAWRDTVPRGSKLWDAEKRQHYTKTPSAATVSSSAADLKSSIRYVYTRDALDSPPNPTEGTYLQLRSELAGLGGDVFYGKQEAAAKLYFPFTQSLVSILRFVKYAMIFRMSHLFVSIRVLLGRKSGGISFKGGYIQPFAPSQGPSSLPMLDRFHYGGENTLRGFARDSVGPRDGLDSQGGNLLGAGSVSLSWAPPHPSLQQSGLRLQSFLNLGSCINTGAGPSPGQVMNSVSTAGKYGNSVSQIMDDFAGSARLSAGAGLVVPFGPLRLELNFSKPIVFQGDDRLQTMQLGFGVQSEWL